MAIALIILYLLAAYSLLGIIFALYFVCIGMNRLDPSAIGSHWTFRLLVLPGAAALWPWLLRRLASTHHSYTSPPPSHPESPS